MGTDVVGLGDLLEEGVGLRRRVLIRMVLHGEAAVGLLELFLRGAAADTQHLVVVQPHRRRLVLPASGRAVRLRLLPELLTRIFGFWLVQVVGIFFWQQVVGRLVCFNALHPMFFFFFASIFSQILGLATVAHSFVCDKYCPIMD